MITVKTFGGYNHNPKELSYHYRNIKNCEKNFPFSRWLDSVTILVDIKSKEDIDTLRKFLEKIEPQFSDIRQRAMNWFNSLDNDFRNKLRKEKRPARIGYVDKGMIQLTKKEIIELYKKHVV